MKKLMISLSVAVFALAMMANIQYALDGYGVDNSNLHAQVLAQSTGTGGTTDGGTTVDLPPITVTCHQTCYHKPAICWGTEWDYNNYDAYCYRTGSMSDKCYAYKCYR